MRRGDSLATDLAGTALTVARRFHAGATMWCVARSGSRTPSHVAVEFVHPVIVGKRALPAVALTGPTSSPPPGSRSGPATSSSPSRPRPTRPSLDHAPGAGLGRHVDLDRPRPPPDARRRRPRALDRRPPIRSCPPPAGSCCSTTCCGSSPTSASSTPACSPSPRSAPTHGVHHLLRRGAPRRGGPRPGRVRTAAGRRGRDRRCWSTPVRPATSCSSTRAHRDSGGEVTVTRRNRLPLSLPRRRGARPGRPAARPRRLGRRQGRRERRAARLHGGRQRGRVAAAAAEMARRFAAGGRMFAFGNGGSSTDVATLVALFARPPGPGIRSPALVARRRPGDPHRAGQRRRLRPRLRPPAHRPRRARRHRGRHVHQRQLPRPDGRVPRGPRPRHVHGRVRGLRRRRVRGVIRCGRVLHGAQPERPPDPGGAGPRRLCALDRRPRTPERDAAIGQDP